MELSLLRESPFGSALRAVLIAYGVAFFSWWFARTLPASDDAWAPGNIYMIALGLALQFLAWVAKRVAMRYEREHEMPGALTPTVANIVRVAIDGVTVLLFAIATFRSVAIVPSNV